MEVNVQINPFKISKPKNYSKEPLRGFKSLPLFCLMKKYLVIKRQQAILAKNISHKKVMLRKIWF